MARTWLTADEGLILNMAVPTGPDDEYTHAYNNYLRATWFGEPVSGKTGPEWLNVVKQMEATRPD